MRVVPGSQAAQLQNEIRGGRFDRAGKGGDGKRDKATFRIVTFNDKFTDRKTDLPNIHGGVVMVQEAKNVRVRKQVDKDTYAVHQNRDTPAEAGSATYWKKDKFKSIGEGQKSLAKPDGNDDMLERFVTWNDLKVRGKDVKVRMASAHRPPGDEKDEWPEFDRNLAKFAAKARRDGIPVVIGMDSNTKDPKVIARMEKLTGLKWHRPPGSIDGFLASPEIRFHGRPHREDKDYSDHRPVAVQITVREPKSK